MTNTKKPRLYSFPSSLPKMRAGRGAWTPHAMSRAQPYRYPYTTIHPNIGMQATKPSSNAFASQPGDCLMSFQAVDSI